MSSQLASELIAAASSVAAQQSAEQYTSWYNSIFGAITSSGNRNGIGEVATPTSAPVSASMASEASTTGVSSPSSLNSQTNSMSVTTSMPSMTTTMQRMTSSQSSITSLTSAIPSGVDQGNDHHDHLSGGAIAGIVIGVLAAVLVIAILAFFCCIRQCLIRRRKRKTEAAIAEKKNESLDEPTDKLRLDRGKVVPAEAPPAQGSPKAQPSNGKIAPPRPPPPLESMAAQHTASRVADAPVVELPSEPASKGLPQVPAMESLLAGGALMAGGAAAVGHEKAKPEAQRPDKSLRSSVQTDDTNILDTPAASSEENLVPPMAGGSLVVPRNIRDSRTGSFKTTSFVRGASMDFTSAPLAAPRPFSPDGDSPVSPYEPMFSSRPISPMDAGQLHHLSIDPARTLSPVSAMGDGDTRTSSAAAEYSGISSPFDDNARLSYGLTSAAGVTGVRTSIGAPPSASADDPPLRLRSDTEGSSEDWANEVRTSVDDRVRRYGFMDALSKEDSPVEGKTDHFVFGFKNPKRVSTGEEPYGGVKDYLRKLSQISSNAAGPSDESGEERSPIETIKEAV